MNCVKCGLDTTHEFCVFCGHMECSHVRPRGQASLCLHRSKHNHFCIKCAHEVLT